MKPEHHSSDAVDLSPLDAMDQTQRREALVAAIMARYSGSAPLDLWSAIAAHARPVGVLAAAALIAAIGSLAIAPTPSPSPALMADAGVPAPFAAWLARPSMPSPLEVMVAMAEIPR